VYVDHVAAKPFVTGCTEFASHVMRIIFNIRTKHFESEMFYKAVPCV
jgi:hypothetical protein